MESGAKPPRVRTISPGADSGEGDVEGRADGRLVESRRLGGDESRGDAGDHGGGFRQESDRGSCVGARMEVVVMAGAVRRLVVVVRVAVRVGGVVGMGMNDALFMPAGLFNASGHEAGPHEGS